MSEQNRNSQVVLCTRLPELHYHDFERGISFIGFAQRCDRACTKAGALAIRQQIEEKWLALVERHLLQSPLDAVAFSAQIRSPAAFYYFGSGSRFNGRKELRQKDLFYILHQQSKAQSRQGLMTMGRSGVEKVVTPDFRHEAYDSIHFVDMMTWFPRLNPDQPRPTLSLVHRLWFGIALNVFHFESNANKTKIVHQINDDVTKDFFGTNFVLCKFHLDPITGIPILETSPESESTLAMAGGSEPAPPPPPPKSYRDILLAPYRAPKCVQQTRDHLFMDLQLTYKNQTLAWAIGVALGRPPREGDLWKRRADDSKYYEYKPAVPKRRPRYDDLDHVSWSL